MVKYNCATIQEELTLTYVFNIAAGVMWKEIICDNDKSSVAHNHSKGNGDTWYGTSSSLTTHLGGDQNESGVQGEYFSEERPLLYSFVSVA